MITKMLLFIFAATFVAGNEAENFVERRDCIKMGLMCENCTSLVYCLQNDNGEWDKYPVGDCGTGLTCNNGWCTPSDHLPECKRESLEIDFVCTQLGLFPHPYNCKKYFMCTLNEENEVIPEPIEIQCKNGWGYDPLRGTCREKLIDGMCTNRPVPECTTVEEQGAVSGNPSMYYICLHHNDELIPYLFHCDDNFEYFDGACRNPIPVGVLDDICIEEGRFIDTANCRNYKDCTTIGQAPEIKTCNLNYKFIPKNSRCEIFQCDCYQ